MMLPTRQCPVIMMMTRKMVLMVVIRWLLSKHSSKQLIHFGHRFKALGVAIVV